MQHFQIRENRIRTFVVSVFDLMSLLYVMNSPIPLCIYVLQKLNGEWIEEEKSLNWNWRASTSVIYTHTAINWKWFLVHGFQCKTILAGKKPLQPAALVVCMQGLRNVWVGDWFIFCIPKLKMFFFRKWESFFKSPNL